MNQPSFYSPQDKILVERVLAGDTAAFGNIIKLTEGLVTQVICRMVANKEDRKDIAQDVYLKAYKNLSSFRFDARLSTWVTRIAYNTCFDYLDKQKLAIFGDIDLVLETPASVRIPELDLKQRSGIINSAIEKLPPILKTLIILYHKEDLSYAEIQHITDLPEGTVKSYLFRARKVLKETLLLHYKKEEI